MTKAITILLVILFISTISFSQEKRGNPRIGQELLDVPMGDMISEMVIKPEVSKEINELELKFMNLKLAQFQQQFAKQDVSSLKTDEEIYNEYVTYLENKIAEEKDKLDPEQQQMFLKMCDGCMLKYFRIPRSKKVDSIRKN